MHLFFLNAGPLIPLEGNQPKSQWTDVSIKTDKSQSVNFQLGSFLFSQKAAGIQANVTTETHLLTYFVLMFLLKRRIKSYSWEAERPRNLCNTEKRVLVTCQL